MTRDEIKSAIRLLEPRTDRIETAICGDGQCLTAHWRDGGQRLFYTLDGVRDWLEDVRLASEHARESLERNRELLERLDD